VFNLHFMKVSTENDNNFGYEKITIVVDNSPLSRGIHVLWTHSTRFYFKFIVGNKGGLKQVFFSYTHDFH
jgi:hypothetical protein